MYNCAATSYGLVSRLSPVVGLDSKLVRDCQLAVDMLKYLEMPQIKIKILFL